MKENVDDERRTATMTSKVKLPPMLSVLIITLLLAGWVAAWINWLFNGELRQFAVSKFFPSRWIGNTDRTEILYMTQDELMTFICTVDGMPEFLRGVLTCPLCMSAHVAGVGAIIAAYPIYAASGGYWMLIPLVWATAAVVGFTSIKKHL